MICAPKSKRLFRFFTYFYVILFFNLSKDNPVKMEGQKVDYLYKIDRILKWCTEQEMQWVFDPTTVKSIKKSYKKKNGFLNQNEKKVVDNVYKKWQIEFWQCRDDFE